jgi:hypothetical protein
MPPVCRIFLQQQLSTKSENVTIRNIIWTQVLNSIILEEPGENQVFGPEILREVERQVQFVRENLQVAQLR